jgi:2-haloacid dehalogenase
LSGLQYSAIGFDLLTALLDTWSVWAAVAGDRALGMRWHAASQDLLRGQAYRPYEDITREAATRVGIAREKADEFLRRFGDFAPWPDVPDALARMSLRPRFIVTNCSRVLGHRAANAVGAPFDLVMTAEEAGAYKPDPRPYAAALHALGLRAKDVLFVAGSAHDVGGAARVGMDVYWANRGNFPSPPDAKAIAVEPDFRGLVDLMEGRHPVR